MKTEDVHSFTNRWERWKKKHFEDACRQFPPRISKVLLKIPLPEKEETEFKSTYLYGKAGTGKTIHAAQIMLTYQRYNFAVMGNRKQSLFIEVPELLLQLRNTYNGGNQTDVQILEQYSQVGLLVLDDLGSEKSTDYAYQMLYLIINRRYNNLLPTIFTSNFSLKELGAHLQEERIMSRISEMCDDVFEKIKEYR
jgi:DNA replication protein DnaC